MKSTILTIAVLPLVFIFAAAEAGGQGDSTSARQLAEARALIRESQDAIVREDLGLTAAEAADFWPLYESYRAAIRPIQDRYVELISEYLRRYEEGQFSDDYADGMLDDYFDIKSDLLRVRKRHIRQFGKILPGVKVARFYQLENKFFANIDAELALSVPLIEAN